MGGLERPVRVELRAAGHAARFVGDDAADGARGLACRVGAELSLAWRQPGVDLTHGRTGLHPNAGAVIEHLDLPEVASCVDEHPAGRGLSAQARTTGSEGERDVLRRAGREQRDDLTRARRTHDDLGNQEIVRGIVGACQAVERLRVDCAGGRDFECTQQRRVDRAYPAHERPSPSR